MPIYITADTAAEASAIYAAKRDRSGEGMRTFPDGQWRDCAISYNGRVWDADGRPVYDPAKECNG